MTIIETKLEPRELEQIQLTKEQEEFVALKKDEMTRKHGEYVVEVIDNVITRLRYHGLRRENTKLGMIWLQNNLKLVDALFQEARQRGISLIPTSVASGEELTCPHRIVEGYLELGNENTEIENLKEEDIQRMGFLAMQYLLSRYYSTSRIDGTYKIFIHSITLDLDIVSPVKPLTVHPMVRVEHFKI